MSNALNICAAVVLITGSMGVAEPTVEPERMAIRVDSGAISDFSGFLAGVAHLSQKKPVILDLAWEQPLNSMTVGTDTSFGHAFPDEPVLFRISQHVIHIGTGPAHRTIKDEELQEYLKELVEAASKSKSVVVPILAADRAVSGARGFRVLQQFRRSGITHIRIPSPIAEQDGAGQPATRPESKSEGSDKPQPEAEGRFR